MKTLNILGVRIDNVSLAETLGQIRDFLSDNRQRYLVTPNPDILLKARADASYKQILNGADLSVPDGIGLIFASWLLMQPLKSRVTGVDLIEKFKNGKLVEPETKRGRNVVHLGGINGNISARYFLLGGFGGAAASIARGWTEVVGWSEQAQGEELFARIRQCKANILLVALGAPKQEYWIAENLNKLPGVKVAIGVGSAFDILSGQIKRSPKLLRVLGLEWLWRAIVEPNRWRKAWRSVVFFPLIVIKSLFSDS